MGAAGQRPETSTICFVTSPASDPDRGTSTPWQPATSNPGELYTVEGQIRSVGAFAQGLTNDDPRLAPYRRSMWRTGLVFVGLAIGIGVVVAVVSSLL